MIDDVGGLAVRAHEEAVMAGSIVSIGALEVAAVRLLPGRGLGRVTLAVPLEGSDTIVRGPAVISRV